MLNYLPLAVPGNSTNSNHSFSIWPVIFIAVVLVLLAIGVVMKRRK